MHLLTWIVGASFCCRALRVAFCALVMVSTLATVEATVVLPADFVEMVDGSQVIVHGRVTEVRAQETEGRRSIESVITLSVTESLKGRPGSTIAFRVPGGQIGRYRRVMVGAPVFSVGDEVVVFLSSPAPMMPVPFGLSQGVYRVTHDEDGRAIVTPPPVMARGIAAERVVRGDPARRALAVDVFSREVRSIAGRAR